MSKSTTTLLKLGDEELSSLWSLSRAGASFYNAAIVARLQSQAQQLQVAQQLQAEQQLQVQQFGTGKQITRVAQRSNLLQLCGQAKIALNTLPQSVMTNLLSALDAAVFGSRDWRLRDRERFWPLCWARKDIESNWGSIELVALPLLRLPLPWVYAGQGRAIKVTISQDWGNEQFSARVEWLPAAPVQTLHNVCRGYESSLLLQVLAGV